MTKERTARSKRLKTSRDRSSDLLEDFGRSRRVPGLNQSRGLLHRCGSIPRAEQFSREQEVAGLHCLLHQTQVIWAGSRQGGGHVLSWDHQVCSQSDFTKSAEAPDDRTGRGGSWPSAGHPGKRRSRPNTPRLRPEAQKPAKALQTLPQQGDDYR